MYGDKKGGASQDGVKTDKGKIFTVSWDGRVDSHRSSLSLQEFAPPERGYVVSFRGRRIGVDPAVQKQASPWSFEKKKTSRLLNSTRDQRGP